MFFCIFYCILYRIFFFVFLLYLFIYFLFIFFRDEVSRKVESRASSYQSIDSEYILQEEAALRDLRRRYKEQRLGKKSAKI